MTIGLVSLIATTSAVGVGLIPLVAIGLSLYRYDEMDPESPPKNTHEVNY